MDRDFKGVWIPKQVWLDDRLGALDKMILTEVDSLDMSDKGCFASNKHIAEFCQCSETKVSNSISKLVKFGFVEIKSFDGRQRILQSCLTKNASLPYKNCKSALQNLRHSNTDNKTVNKTESKGTTPENDLDEFPPEVKTALLDWFIYKAERKESYKPKGRESFLSSVRNKLKQYKSAAVVDVIQNSMANNWKGIIWDTIDKTAIATAEPVLIPKPEKDFYEMTAAEMFG